jgi:hypothetical protein
MRAFVRVRGFIRIPSELAQFCLLSCSACDTEVATDGVREAMAGSLNSLAGRTN